jgi:hypothetical protein
MAHHVRARRFALVFALGLALVSVFFVHRSSAAAVYILRGPASDSCDRTGSQATATFQDDIFGSELHGFWDRESVTVTFSFPDGRIFSPDAAELLDGVVNMPTNFTTIYQTDVAGDLYFEYPVTGKWPYGCYQMSAYGNSSGQSAVGFLVIKPRGAPVAPPAPARLAVWKNGTFEAFAEHGALVNIHGANFMPNELVGVWVTQPDGTVIGHPTQVASDAGNFESTFQFTGVHQTGKYTFTALGLTSGYQVFAPFELRGGTSVPSGWAQLRVAYPFPAETTQNGAGISVAGSLFSPGEPVGIWLTLPDGSVRGLPVQLADGNGDFYAVLAIDERLPLGTYDVTASGVNSGRLVIAQFEVNGGTFQGVPEGTPPEPPAPFVETSNFGDGTLGGPTNIQGQENSAGPQITPPDVQSCTGGASFWTPNC